MPDRDFEKKVQLKMDELKLRPSDAVWAGVEKNLRREKRRRRAVLWLPLLGLLLATGGYFIFTGSQHTGTSPLVNEKAGIPSTQNRANTTPATDNNTITDNNNEGNKTGKNSTTINQPDIAVRDNTTDQQSTKNSNGVHKTIPVQQGKNNVPAHPGAVVKNNTGGTTLAGAINKKSPEGKKPAAPPLEQYDLINNIQTETADNNTTITASEPAVDEEKPLMASAVSGISYRYPTPLVSADMALTPAVTAKKQKKPSKWQWGIQANAGVTNMAEGDLFNLFKAARVEDLSYNDQAMPSIGFTGFGPPPPPAEPSPLEAGPSLSIGFFVKRPVSKRISLSAGLQYSYFSLRTTVGTEVDNLVTVNVGANSSQLTNRYYLNSAADAREYTNRYHFIELPVNVSIQLNNSARLPITWDAGVAVSRLLNTNALHYDGVSGVYYKNNDLFNKTQLLITSGFNIGIFQQRKHPVFIGPGIRYYATSLVRKEVSDGQHLWSAGINLRMLIKK